MAKENYFSSQVCELIAQELVKEQAEVLKHEAIVEGIKKTILEKKTEVIKKRFEHKAIRLNKKKYNVIEVYTASSDEKIMVMMTLDNDPEPNDLGIEKSMAWIFTYDDATKPGFFEHPGLGLGIFDGVGDRTKNLEDYITSR